ncbi:MAG TPA: polysaccharide biosynthesis/export family protein [Allosphingosinicella sp.]|jgi:polysaccharide export outer membrane protein
MVTSPVMTDMLAGGRSFARVFGRATGAVIALALLAGCGGGGRGGPIPYNVEPTVFTAPDTPAVATLEEDYRIAPLDTVKVSVFQVPDLSGEFEVDLTGNIAMPLLGNVKAVDMTTAQLDQRLTQQLGAKYLQSPDVSIGIKSSTRRNVTVDGAVRNPGVFPVNGPITLIQVIALAKGTEENANPRRVAVFRQIGGKRMAAAFDLTSIRRGEMEDPRIYTGDIVVVDGSNIKEVQKQVLQALPILGFFRPFG